MLLFGGFLALLLTFWLPSHILSPPWAFSESYLYGFNNKVFQGMLLLVLAGAAAFTWLGFLRLPAASRAEPANVEGLTPRFLAIALLFTAVFAGMIAWIAGPPGGLFDGYYFIDRINLIERGLKPFRDFEFVYGTAPLYTVIFLHKALGVPVKYGYQMLWFTETCLGVLLLGISIRWLDLPKAGKKIAFLVFFSFALMLVPGDMLNYCILRYSLPLFALVGFCRLDRDDRTATRLQTLSFAVVFDALLLNISPEEGLVYGVAICLYLPLRRRAACRPFVLETVAFVAAFALFCVRAAFAGAFVTMARFSHGAFNFPAYPAPPVLLAVASLILLIVFVFSLPTADRLQSNTSLIALYVMGMIPAAMGRCDSVHLGGYLLPAVLCFCIISWRWRALWTTATLGSFLFFSVVPFALFQLSTGPVLGKALLTHVYRHGTPTGGIYGMLDRLALKQAVRSLGEVRGRSKIEAMRRLASTSEDPQQLFPGASTTVAVPFEYFPNKVSPYQSPTVAEGHFMGIVAVMTPEDLEQKIDEIRIHPEQDLVVSREGFDDCHPTGANRRLLAYRLQLPWVPAPIHSLDLLTPYCDYIQTHYVYMYQPGAATFGYGLMRRSVP